MDHRAVARLHAEANNSDPFAYSRMTLHLKHGLDHPQDVRKDAETLLQRRRERMLADYERNKPAIEALKQQLAA